MADQIPVIDGAAAFGEHVPDRLLAAVRGATGQDGVIQVVRQGMAARREGRPYVAELSRTSAGR